MVVLSSPRRRRRLAWLAGFLAVAAALVVLATLFPNTSGYGPQHFSNTPVQRVHVQRQVPVTAARRAEVNALFDRFVPAAIERKDPGAAYDLVTSEGRAGLTRADWRSGQLPVFAYDAKGSTFHGWRTEASFRNEMDVELDLQPASPKDGPVAYAVTLKRIGGRWLVDSIYPRTTYAPTQPAARSGKQTTGPQPDASIPQAKTGVAWLLIAALVVLILGAPAVFFVTQWWSGRRHRSRFSD